MHTLTAAEQWPLSGPGSRPLDAVLDAMELYEILDEMCWSCYALQCVKLADKQCTSNMLTGSKPASCKVMMPCHAMIYALMP